MVNMICPTIAPIFNAFDFNDLISRQNESITCVRKGERLPMHTQAIWLLQRGILQLQCQDFDRGITVLGWRQSNSFCLGSMTRLATTEAIALTDCFCLQFSPEELQRLPGFQTELLTQMGQQLHQTEYLLAIAGLKRIEDRLSALLYLLKQNFGKEENEKIRLCCRFTHQNLADTIGSTRVTITRLMKDFQTQGWLSVDENRHILIDPYYQPEQLL
jgi:hypothetical protein